MAPKSEKEGKRNAPRRLFSFDSIKSSSTRRSSSEGTAVQDNDSWKLGQTHLKASTLAQVEENNAEGKESLDKALSTNWMDKDLADSPKSLSDSSNPMRIESPQPDSLSLLSQQEKRQHTRSTTPEPLRHSSSRARWEHLRQQVLPPSRQPSTHSVIPQQPPQITAPPRSTTPKPSRLARLGFRHVVDHAREIDEVRRFTEEVQRICWSYRHIEPSKSKGDREMATNIGSSLYLPFMSTTSLAPSGASGAGTSNTKKQENRRPPSDSYITTAFRGVPTLKVLYQYLLHSSGIFSDPTGASNFPHESLVLSTLLKPFLLRSNIPNAEEEQWFAIETFNIITKSWTTIEDTVHVARCLWCCKAALIPSSAIRTRLITSLYSILIPSQQNQITMSPRAVQTILNSLFVLISSPLYRTNDTSEDFQLLGELISQFFSGACGTMDDDAVSTEYNSTFEKNERRDLVTLGTCLQALAESLENGEIENRIWLLQHPVQDYWPVFSGDSSLSSLVSSVYARKLNAFCRASLAFLLSSEIILNAKDLFTKLVIHFFTTRVIPEIDALQDNLAIESRNQATRVVLELFGLVDKEEMTQWLKSNNCRWNNDFPEWKGSYESTLRQIIASGAWSQTIHVLSILANNAPDEIRRPAFTFALPLLNDQLVENPPPYPYPELSSLLEKISHDYPQLFFKPFFACAASSKEFTVVNHLCTVVVHSKFIPDYWIRDAEMVSVALMSDAGGKQDTSEATRSWAQARLGQSVLLVEMIGHLQAIRHAKEAPGAVESSFGAAIRFVMALESRISILLEAKEKKARIPPSQRMLFCLLFREIRLLTRSLRAPLWLPRAISWLVDYYDEEAILTGESEEEFDESVTRIQGLYVAAQAGARQSHKRRSTMLLSSPSPSKPETAGLDLGPCFSENSQLLDSLSKGLPCRVMKLLVTVSTLVSPEDYCRLCPVLWVQGFLYEDSSTIASACFLVMQCAEKAPSELLAVITLDLQSSDDTARLDAIHKISTLINWRFQILSQNVLSDRTHRPFKLARSPLPFIATDMGSSQYVYEEFNDAQEKVPLELKKRLAEIGWAEEQTQVDQRQEWIRTPMSLLPTSKLDHLDSAITEQINMSPVSPMLTPQSSPRKTLSPTNAMEGTGLLRRNSSTGGPIHGAKRRAIFVPTLASVFSRIAMLVFDPNLVIASTARQAILDLMRNDPALLLRPILDSFSGEGKDVASAISTLTALLHISPALPPPTAHAIFNNLAGFLKLASKSFELEDTLQDFSLAIPIIARLATQVSGMSIREIRRAKIEVFVIPSGSLWFSSTAPSGPMFPRNSRPSVNPFLDASDRLHAIVMIRIAQNMLFISMLKRNNQDVQLIRKNLARFVLPTEDDQMDGQPLSLRDYVPRKTKSQGSIYISRGGSATVLSLMLSRSHLLLVAQIFRSMSRHLSDRIELAILIDGVNRILLEHGNDIGIVSQALIALLVASTRFRRLFTSGGGYSLFMPAIVKIYTEAEAHLGIRLAIEYAANRFYALHRESFLFQSLDALVQIPTLSAIETEWFSKGVYDLFFSLSKGISASTPDAAGIHDVNKLQEREALIVTTAEEKPQTFLAAMRRTESQAATQVPFDLPEEYESRRLGMDDFVRLFLTVIAHDPSIVRAEHFLKLFRFLTPYLHHATSSARSVLREGIDALCHIMTKFTAKSKNEDAHIFSSAILDSTNSDKLKTASDMTNMRLDYLMLVKNYGHAGGQVSLNTARQIIDLTKVMMKELSHENAEMMTVFFASFVKTLLIREDAPSAKAVTSFLRGMSGIIQAYFTTIDFSGVFEVVSQLLSMPLYANDPNFCQMVVLDICNAGLAACETAASENLLQTLPRRSALVSFLADAVMLRSSDVVLEMIKRRPSYGYLIGVILPVVLSLKTESKLLLGNTKVEPWHRMVLGKAWIRLLFYAMSVCENNYRTSGSSNSSDAKSRDKHRPDDHSQMPAFLSALQVIKAIVVQAESEISKSLPAIWERLAGFLKSILANGGAEFALHSQDRSATPSPMPSPRSSGQFDLSYYTTSSSNNRNGEQSFARPRMLDYALWSFLEFICTYRNPLSLQLRLFTIEKVVAVDQELKYQNGMLNSPMSVRTRRISSIFTKPRQRVSGMSPSPHSSPKLKPSQTNLLDTSYPSLLDIRQHMHSPLPSSPTRGNTLPRIVHLGPASPSVLQNSPLLPGIGGSGNMQFITNSAMKVKSSKLIEATYRRVRTVQMFMGYDMLLPIPSSSADTENAVVLTWSKLEALEKILDETKELMEEFEETFQQFREDVLVPESNYAYST